MNKIVALKPRCHKSLALKPNVRTKLLLQNQNVFKTSCFKAQMSEHKSYFETKCVNKTFASKPKCFLKNLATKFKCLNIYKSYFETKCWNKSLASKPKCLNKGLSTKPNCFHNNLASNSKLWSLNKSLLLKWKGLNKTLNSKNVWTKVLQWNQNV